MICRSSAGVGRGPGRLAATGLVIALLVAGCGAPAGSSGEPAARSAGFDASPATVRPSQPSGAGAVLQRLDAALADRSEAGFTAGWAPHPASQRQASLVFHNLVSLGVVALGPRLVPGTTRGSGPAWHADVALSWRLEGARAVATADSSMVYGFVDSGARTLVASVAPAPGARLPIWMLPGLHVRRGTRTLAAAGSAVSATRVGRLLDDAVVAVGAVLPHWRGGLVAYAPATAQQFGRLIATPPGRYAGIAAVTTSVDGSDAPSAPFAIVVSPRVFASLGPLGARVVIAHEATHVATRAADDMPLWVAEGFADYVGIGSVDVAVPVAAQAALRVVRSQGAPVELPDDAAFAVGGSGLEATYEEAWLATSLIARRYGRGALVAFYRHVERHPGAIDAAFAAALHTSRASFTVAWRTYLADLARAG